MSAEGPAAEPVAARTEKRAAPPVPLGSADGVSVVLTVAYDGAPFAGFARQPGLETVQGRLESALATVLRHEVITTGAGRTDSGVHALGQVVSFPASAEEVDPATLLRSLNALAGPMIVVRDVRLAPAGFDARHSAIGREYRYRLSPGWVPPLFLREYSWWVRELDVEAMREASALLVGEHDFTSFCVAASTEGQRTVRRLDVLEVAPDAQMGERCVAVRAYARSFLHSMVRILVGTLVEVGTGRRRPEWAAEALHARDRSSAGPTAPPHGLTLWQVTYPDGSVP